MNVKEAMSRSTSDFIRLVWPAIGADLGDLAPVESVTANAFAKELDIRSGIDHWILRKDGHMSGLASRVQWADRSCDTFTVRTRARYGGATEYHKRKMEMDHPGQMISPWYMCQAYVSRDRSRLIAAALSQTWDVIGAVGQEIGYKGRPNPDGTEFWVVPWRDLQACNARLNIWRPGQDPQFDFWHEQEEGWTG